MSSLPILILYFVLLTTGIVDMKNIYFTQSNYDIWCQENILSNSLFLYPNRIRTGIQHTSDIKSVVYHIIENEDDSHNHGLFYVKTKRLSNFYFFILEITRPLDINREYQDLYILHIQADISTLHGNTTEQAKVYLHVADSNDNDGVFDMDLYEKHFSDPIEFQQALIGFRASDADEVQHAQMLYELSSTFNDTFSLHPYTGELYLMSKMNLQSLYDFEIYVYDRHRKYLVSDNIKTKASVKLTFKAIEVRHRIPTISNQTVEFQQMISNYKILFSRNSNWNYLNIHQPILIMEVAPRVASYEMFILDNSSLNAMDLFFHQNKIYLNKFYFQEYHLRFLICFYNRTKCQYTNYDFIPSIDWNLFQFYFKTVQPIFIEENLPIDSFITQMQVQYNHDIIPNRLVTIRYELLNNHVQFHLHPETAVLRLGKYIKCRMYNIGIQANVHLFNRTYSIKTSIEVTVRETNKYRPIFSNQTLTELDQLPYQFHAYDFDLNQQTNGHITYYLSNCYNDCPFEINPNDGLLSVRRQDRIVRERTYYLQVVAFDWGEPIGFETRIDVQINLSHKFIQQDYISRASDVRLLKNRSISEQRYVSNGKTVYLNVGFNRNSTSYRLSEDAEINTIIDRLRIDYDSFPIFINNEYDNLFFYTINDTSVPFAVDQNEKTIQLIVSVDREKQDRYVFEIALKLKPSYVLKLQDVYNFQEKNASFHFQYSNKFYQKMLVIIDIDDVNDNAPVCDHFHQRVALPENQTKKNLFRVQATDPDLAENGTVIYSLLDSHQYFSINSSTGQIDCIRPLDREQTSTFQLHVIASDQGSQLQLQSLCMTLHLTVIDVNDNVPQFSATNYTYQIFSDLPRDTIFGQVYATDLDATDNLIYSIQSNAYVRINPYTGHLRLKTNLHHLIDQVLNTTVHVSDGLHSNFTWLVIRVLRFMEVQDPILLREPAFDLRINRSLPTGTVITNIYQHLQLVESSIDFVEMIPEEDTIPFIVDQQGSIRTIRLLTDLSNSSYWLPIRLTRYRARPPHSYVYIHISISEEDLYSLRCVDLYQHVKVYDYLMHSTFARIQALSSYDNIDIQYSIINNNTDETLFSIQKANGFIQLLPSVTYANLSASVYFLTIQALDVQHDLSIDCYVDVSFIRRHQLIPTFLYTSTYRINLLESSSNSQRLRQRLFQIVALLDHEVYGKNLEIRYQIMDPNEHFIINRQTGYIAARQILYRNRTYSINVEAYVAAYRNDIEYDDSIYNEQSNRAKWRTVSPRVSLSIEVHILPKNNNLISLPNESTIQIDLLASTKVGSILSHLKTNTNEMQWFIMIGNIEHTRYFHVNLQSGELFLIRPIDELMNQTTIIELRINHTNDWISMNTIQVIVHIINDQRPVFHFSQNDYYASVLKTLAVGTRIMHLIVENSFDNCTYSIHSAERIKSKDLFHVDPYSGAVTTVQSLEHLSNKKHLLTIIYRCPNVTHVASTRLHITIIDKEKQKAHTKHSYKFSRDNYLVVFETSFIKNQKRYLIDLELINNYNYSRRIKPDAQIIEGDPLGLFAIDSANQSLFLLDESRTRSYIYPMELIIVDASQIKPIYCIVTIFISNIGIQFTCPSDSMMSPHLLTYKSIPPESIDPLTGQQYDLYSALTIYGFDSLAPLNLAKCSIDPTVIYLNEQIDFMFDKEFYYGYVNDSFGPVSFIYHNQNPVKVSIKNRDQYMDSFNITYEMINQTNINSFELDAHAGTVKYTQKSRSLVKASLVIVARYQALIAIARLNVIMNDNNQSNYKFILYKPFVNNYTIGYIKERRSNMKILNRKMSTMFSIEHNGRLSVKNQTLISANGNVYNMIVGKARVQINVLSKEIMQCSLNRFSLPNDSGLIGLIESAYLKRNYWRKRAFYLLNYNHLFILEREHGLLRLRNANHTIVNDLVLLIEIESSRCLVTVHGMTSIPYRMIRMGNSAEIDNEKLIDVDKQFSGLIKLRNGIFMNFDVIPSQAPIFTQNFYSFTVNVTHYTNKTIFVGRISAQPFHENRSHIVYEFVSMPKDFIIHPDRGIIEYILNDDSNQIFGQYQIIARDLIYRQNTTVNITIDLFKSNSMSRANLLVYNQTVSEVLPPGSTIFQPNMSSSESLQYSLQDYNPDLFTIDTNTGQVTLLNFLTDRFYSLKIYISPIHQFLIIKLTILNYNYRRPIFHQFPRNLTITSDDTFVSKLSAYDLDLADNHNLTYYLLDKHQQKSFSINEKTGIITQKRSSNKTHVQLKVAVGDGLHLTAHYLPITIYDYSKHAPKFVSDEYSFPYNKILGQISAYDLDENDQITYKLYLEPTGITIDPYSGLITLQKVFLPQTIEFYASASDNAQQVVYTKIQIIFPVQPKFASNLFFISLKPSVKVPSDIFHLQLVDSMNQPLSSTRFKIDQTNFFDVNENQLVLKKQLHPSKIYYFNIYGYWKNYTCQTSIQIIYVDEISKLDRPYYEFSLEKNVLRENAIVEKFKIKKKSILIITSTPLTRNNCIDNFYIKRNKLFFKTYPILSEICFFEIQLSNEKSLASSQIKISFVDSYVKPTFSSSIYYFYTNNMRVFAKCSNAVRYRLQTNPYGLYIHHINGILSFNYDFSRIKTFTNIQLFVYAIDEKTSLNDTAVIHIQFTYKKPFVMPNEISPCSNIPKPISDRTLPGTIIQNIHDNNESSTYYYILSGDKYGLFSINNIGQLSLTSPILNQTSEKYFELVILMSSTSISYCRTNISIIRTPHWSYFICPVMPIEWKIEEESPIGTQICNITDILVNLNNDAELIKRINMKISNTDDAQAFHLNSTSGLLTSKVRLDYEQKHVYLFTILLEPATLQCSLFVLIKLINIEDNLISFHQKSLMYNVNENNNVPFYVGRIELVDPDQLHSFKYQFFIKNSSSLISIDRTTGSIVLLAQLDRELHGEKLQYEIVATDSTSEKNLTDSLVIHINDLNDHGPLFEKNFYEIKVNKSSQPGKLILTVAATSDDPIMNGHINYSLINSSSLLVIDEHTGSIRLNEYIPSTIHSILLLVEAFEDGINQTDRTNILISIVNDDEAYFQIEHLNECSIDENRPIGTSICVIGRDSMNFTYNLIDPDNLFEVIPSNGTILSRNVFDYETDPHEYTVTIVVKDRNNQTVFFSSINVTIQVRNLNDNAPEFLTKNFTRLLYLFYPLANTILYKIEFIDKDPSNLTYEILNDNLSTYTLRTYSNSIELILIKTIISNRDDDLIIRIWDDGLFCSDLNISILYQYHEIEFPKIISQTIDGYVNIGENYPTINLGHLLIDNHSQYHIVSFNLIPHKYFFLKQISDNQTELYFKSFHSTSVIEYQIHVAAMAVTKSIPETIFHRNYNNQTKLFFPPNNKFHTINIQLSPIHREMLDRTISLTMNFNSDSTYEQFISNNISFVRQTLAHVLDLNIYHVHLYTFDLKQHQQIELLICAFNSTSKQYIDKKILYEKLKNSSDLFHNILLSQCQSNTCENNAQCLSSISLFPNQYNYLYSNKYQLLIPKYQWITKCVCARSYYGERCQFKYDRQSPCSSNPCLPLEQCIEESAELYSCQCLDELCNYQSIARDSSFDCININSPTCRDSSKAFTFDGHSLIRMNMTNHMMKHVEVSFSFRTQLSNGKLFEFVYFIEKLAQYHLILIQIINGFVNIEYNQTLVLHLNQTLVDDGQWHDVYFSIDYSHYYYYYYYYHYLVRLDHVFGEKMTLPQQRYTNKLMEITVGADFKGCVGNITLNNRMILPDKEKDSYFIEFIGIDDGCQLTTFIPDQSHSIDFCSVNRPCYHGGICINDGLGFMCNCSKPRFTGRQCQFDLYPCESHPCQYHEQCVPLLSNSDKLFTCILSIVPLPMSITTYLYIGSIIISMFLIIFILLVCYCRKRKENLMESKTLAASVPLMIDPRSSTMDKMDNPRQTLLQLNCNDEQDIRTLALKDDYTNKVLLNYFNNKNYSKHDSPMAIPTEDLLVRDSSTEYDNNDVLQETTDFFDFSVSPTQYFNFQNSNNEINYPIRLSSLSNLTKNFAKENDLVSSHSSDDSSNNEQLLLTTSMRSRDFKKSCMSDHGNVSSSVQSLPKLGIYARIVKTPKISSTISMNSTKPSISSSFIKPMELDDTETSPLTTKGILLGRLRHASDTDIHNKPKPPSIKLSSFFQTDV